MRMPAPAGKTETYDRARSGRGAVRRGRAGGGASRHVRVRVRVRTRRMDGPRARGWSERVRS